MLSVVLPARSGRILTQRCLESLRHTFFEVPVQVEFVLIDDASFAGYDIPGLFREFRSMVDSPVTAVRFAERQHFTRVLAYGLYQARGERIFFVSNDMQVTPTFLQRLLEVSNQVPEAGVVRGTSAHTDAAPEHCVRPPRPLRSYAQILAFSQAVAEQEGENWTEGHLLSADAILIKRAVVDRLGSPDVRMRGYYSDLDYGLRAQRAGFKLVCAKGAWLHHEGAGHIKEEALLEQVPMEVIHRARYRLIQADYEVFRHKWQPSLPADHRGVQLDPASLLAVSRQRVPEYLPPPRDFQPEILSS